MSAVIHRPPDPPLTAEGALAVTAAEIVGLLTPGHLAGCCACPRPTRTWYSACPPSGYAPLHRECVDRLISLWEGMIRDGDIGPDVAPALVDTPRRGAYARRAPTVAVAPRARVVAARVLPDGFVPGPYWLPGDDERTPWTVLLETAAGHAVCPCGPDRERARRLVHRFSLTRELSRGAVPVVGGVVIGPDGRAEAAWGEAPSPSGPRWSPVQRVGDWRTCGRCGSLRWPGCWMSTTSWRCLPCVVAEEVDDPRPPLADPSDPGEAHVPERFRPKSGKSARRR